VTALNIKILGPGCANCYILAGLAVAAVQMLSSQKPELFENVEVTLEHLHEQSDFRKYGGRVCGGLVCAGGARSGATGGVKMTHANPQLERRFVLADDST